MIRGGNLLKIMPSRKFVGLFAIILIFSGVMFFFLKKSSLTYDVNQKTPALSSTAVGISKFAAAAKDSDNDGLKDWEEALWKTDPNNADTDGDRTPDGEEIRQNRDPLKPGPDDKLLQIKDEGSISEAQDNLTNELARRLTADYFSQKAKGIKPVVSGEKLIQDVLNKTQAQNLNDEFLQKDFQKFSKATTENKKNYLNQLGNVLKNNFKNAGENELTILFRSLEKEDKTELKKLEKYETAYQKTVNDFKNLEIPDEINYLNLHLLIINNMNNLHKSVGAMQFAFSDPLKMILGLNWYLNEAQRWQKFENDFEVLATKEGFQLKLNNGDYILE